MPMVNRRRAALREYVQDLAETIGDELGIDVPTPPGGARRFLERLAAENDVDYEPVLDRYRDRLESGRRNEAPLHRRTQRRRDLFFTVTGERGGGKSSLGRRGGLSRKNTAAIENLRSRIDELEEYVFPDPGQEDEESKSSEGGEDA